MNTYSSFRRRKTWKHTTKTKIWTHFAQQVCVLSIHTYYAHRQSLSLLGTNALLLPMYCNQTGRIRPARTCTYLLLQSTLATSGQHITTCTYYCNHTGFPKPAHPCTYYVCPVDVLYTVEKPSIRPCIHLSVYPFIRPSTHPSMYPFLHLPIHPCIHVSSHPSIRGREIFQ